MFARSLVALSLATVVLGQTGYGRFPCTNVNGDGTFSADQTKCASGALIAPGTDTTNTAGNQGDGVTPTNSVCTRVAKTGAYFCGVAGATCTSSANCDNGVCKNGVCQGGFTQACASDDTNCSGFLYCNAGDFTPTTGKTCGGLGAFCQDYTQGSSDFTNAENYAIFNQFCNSGYCNTQTGNCANHGGANADCSSDPEFFCATGYTCNASNRCAKAPTTSQRARRSLARRSGACPASHTACSIANSATGFECIDTESNLEQCGACASAGGVDCTALPGVEAVGCVAGQCEIWACAEGFSWDAATSACAVSLVL